MEIMSVIMMHKIPKPSTAITDIKTGGDRETSWNLILEEMVVGQKFLFI